MGSNYGHYFYNHYLWYRWHYCRARYMSGQHRQLSTFQRVNTVCVSGIFTGIGIGLLISVIIMFIL